MTPTPENIYVNYISVNVSRMSISSCGIIFYRFSMALYLVVQDDGMVGESIWCVLTLRYGALIILYTLGSA